jgi:vancomycin resistance protein VanJ
MSLLWGGRADGSVGRTSGVRSATRLGARAGGDDVWDTDAGENRAHHVLADVDGAAVHLVNLHLAPPQARSLRRGGVRLLGGFSTATRRSGVDQLMVRLQPLAAGPDPLIVAGDLNMTELAPEYDRLRAAGLTDAHERAGRGFGWTFPATPVLRLVGLGLPPGPVVRIDHVLFSRQLDARRVTVHSDPTGSDHRPLVVDLGPAR